MYVQYVQYVLKFIDISTCVFIFILLCIFIYIYIYACFFVDGLHDKGGPLKLIPLPWSRLLSG